MGSPSDPVLHEATIKQLETEASYIEENGVRLQKLTGLAEFRDIIKRIKNETLAQINDEVTKNRFEGFMEEADDIIFELQTMLTNGKLFGYGRRRRALANALKSAAGVLKVIVAIILSYHDSV
ncbi:MAG TPA: hypothetical protein PLC89_00365 [Haliscomenobacter sp.]|uniref:hypothetical protein n=1 Tax=Haliscomenobacter sp. TaxID=2717303 RepID=UPI002C1F780F|nr:hypothetical protein [Haliscomenobacter sp.]HOY15705.1 hypothetical protein [Haliscomenobacter sp.]HPH17566.1 hypothetical protein [Haliscomenobacter sp.]